MEPVSVGLVDDDAIVRIWVRQSLEGTEFRVAGEARTGAEALTLIERRRPALLLLDYRLPDGNATDLVRTIRRSGSQIPILIITATPSEGLNETALEAGAQGVILKRGDPDDLLRSLRAVASGVRVLDPDNPRRPPGTASLSPRERELLRLVGDGATNREIAERLGIGRETVKTMLSRAFAKLGARNRIEAVAAARERGML
jgi:DNA-binding NarL/FixJ family response regulator